MVVPTMDSLPRVPDTHGDVVDEKLFSDLYIRTTWVDAQIAMDQIDKGKARGNRTSIYLRSVFQSHLESLGNSVQKHAGKVLFVAILVLSTFCVGLKSVQIHSKVHQLWIQEGGRLETELAYTKKTIGEAESSTHQLLIQTGHDPNASVLHPQALLTHLEVLKKATSVKIHMFDTDWSLRDMCNSPTTPSFEGPYYIEQIFKHLIPCSIITPLDCFWEGSQLLGPEFPVQIPGMDNHNRITWSTLNPSKLMQSMKKQMNDQNISFDFGTIEQYMKRAAITSGYTEKPCLNPKDPQCPETAPNKNSNFPLDIGGILTGGCYGFAAKYMHWPEELIVGGVLRNRTGHLKKAKGVQTVVQLMTEKEMYDFWNENYKVHHISWTPEKAAEVLNAWQKNFSKEVEKIMSSPGMSRKYDVYVFSSATLDDILEKFSNPKPLSILIGVIATVGYAFCTLIRWRDPVKGQSSVGVAGVLLIGFSTAAGLGLCAILGIVFNAASTQVVPFLALGLGVDHIFMLTAAYSESNRKEETKYILKKVGPSILFSACATTGSFFAAAFIPVPALKVFCLQAAIVMCFNLAAALLVFPAMISLDLRRRTAGRADISCCCFPIWKERPIITVQHINNNQLRGTTSRLRGPTTVLTKSCNNARTSPALGSTPQEEALLSCSAEKRLPSFSLAKFAVKYYTPMLMKSWVKFIVVMSFVGTVIFSLYASTKLQDGLDLIDLVPKETNEYKFLNAQTSMFGFYSMYAVTQGNFEYPNNQRLLHEYHEAFVRVPHVIKNDNGGLPDFWLSLFRDWLRNLQKIFDREYKDGCINQEGWHSNASSDAILAYKLLVQTGYIDNPVDKSLVVQHRLVDNEGIINPRAFYNYLSAWATNDVFAYGASQAKLHPEPRQYYHLPTEYDLKIPKSLPLVYSQLPFYLHGLTDTSEIKSLIGHIRDLSIRFESRGLPNYPSGIPFIFWEQYMTLRSSLALILCCCIVAAFILVSVLLLSMWAAALVVFSVLASLAQIFGTMTLLGMKLSALPAVILILSVGMILCFTVHITLGFMTSVGNRERRILLSLQVTLGPLTHGILTSALAVFMLSTSPFEFVIRHFFWLLLAVLCVGAFNSLVVFPIILSMIGPEAELVPLEHPDRISTPSPQMSRTSKRANKTVVMGSSRTSSRSCQKQHFHHKDVNDPSLTTITEEPPSWKSSNSSIQMNNEWATANPGMGGHYGSNINNYGNNINYHHTPSPSPPPPNFVRQQPPHIQSTRHHYNKQPNYAMHPPPPPQYHHKHQPPPPTSSSTKSSNNASVGSHNSHTTNMNANNNGMNNFPPELQSIVVQPEVTVETHHSDTNTTKVTATANIKVELVTPGRAIRSYNFTS